MAVTLNNELLAAQARQSELEVIKQRDGERAAEEQR